MDFRLPADFFSVRSPRRAPRDDFEAFLGADAHVHLERSVFVTGLRDWRSTPDTSARHTVHIEDGEWHPL